MVLLRKAAGRRRPPKALAWFGAPAGSLALTALDLAPVDLGLPAQGGGRDAGDRRASNALRELLQRQAAPQVGRGGVPGAVALAADEAVGELADVVLPAGSSITASSRRAVLTSPLAISHHQLSSCSVLKPSLVPWKVRRALSTLLASSRRCWRCGTSFTRSQDVEPVDHRAGGPLVRRDGDAAEHAALGLAVARERLERGQLAHVEVLARAPELARGCGLRRRRSRPGSIGARTSSGQREGRVELRRPRASPRAGRRSGCRCRGWPRRRAAGSSWPGRRRRGRSAAVPARPATSCASRRPTDLLVFCSRQMKGRSRTSRARRGRPSASLGCSDS